MRFILVFRLALIVAMAVGLWRLKAQLAAEPRRLVDILAAPRGAAEGQGEAGAAGEATDSLESGISRAAGPGRSETWSP